MGSTFSRERVKTGATVRTEGGGTPERDDSVDSLSAWSPFGREDTEYALRRVASAAERRRQSAPVLLDRRKLEEAFRDYGGCGRGLGEKTGGGESGPYSNSLRAENAWLAREIAKLKNEIKKKKRCPRRRSVYEKQIDKEYSILNNEFTKLKEESLRILCSGIGDRKIDVRVLANLNNFRQFFHEKLSEINSVHSTWSMQYKVYLLEQLKKLYTQNVSQVDELINMIIETK